MPVAGLEPARYHYRGILSPLRLPIPSHGHALKRFLILLDEQMVCNAIYRSNHTVRSFFSALAYMKDRLHIYPAAGLIHSVI